MLETTVKSHSKVHNSVKLSRHIPILRFSEFNGEWNRNTFGQIALKIGSGSTPRGGEKVYQKSGVPFIRSQNVTNNSLVLNDITFISEDINKKMKGSVVYDNDILLNITGGSIGRSCVVPEHFGYGNVNQHVCIIRLKRDYDPHFIQPFLTSFKGQKLVFQGQTGSGREGLNFSSIASFKISLPALPEQQKIASFLTAVGTKIQQLTKKKELLEQYKKGVVQQIFSREIRFKDENGNYYPDWEEKRLGELFSIKYGKDYKHLKKGNIPVVGTGGIMTYVNQYLYDKPSVLIGRKGTIDKPQFWESPFWTVDTLFYTEINEDFLPYYVFLIISNINWRMYNEATGVPSLNTSSINNVKASVSVNSEEQQKIANFLTGNDKKINLIDKQLEHVKLFKKGLLQQMFV